MEITNHIEHLTVTFDRLVELLGLDRVVVEDVDPLCGAVKIRIHQPQKKETGRMS